jgi:hypothetical protein
MNYQTASERGIQFEIFNPIDASIERMDAFTKKPRQRGRQGLRYMFQTFTTIEVRQLPVLFPLRYRYIFQSYE